MVRPLLEQDAPIRSQAQFAVDDLEFNIQPMGEFNERDIQMTLFSNYTNFGTITLLILGVTLFALLCPWRNLPTNLDTLLKSLWRLSGPVAVTWAIFVLVMTQTLPSDEWLLTTTAIPCWEIALVLLIATGIFAIFKVKAGQPTSNPSDIQKRFGLISWTRRTAHFVIGLWGCALLMLMGAFLITTIQLIQEVLDTSNQDTIRHLAIALPAVAAASAGLIDDRFRNNPTSVTDDKCSYLEKYLTTS